MKMCSGGKAGQLYRGHPGSQASVGSGCSEVLAERTRWKRGLTDVGSFVVEPDTAKVMDDDARSYTKLSAWSTVLRRYGEPRPAETSRWIRNGHGVAVSV
ncbi:hypothetical protein CSOJ01_08723 [Colletotrichum sojae]|uniref:Uncharacterized protein n=1 Tax=Colletotrichum sojae TaxID=2175907 RepID=A0A8H6J4V8_9PEZI|nr:hypothetical protein CSOJ01_08723 [Colletotrichum sojae]